MAVVYAANLAVVDRDSWRQPDFQAVIDCVGSWAGLPKGETGQFPGRRPRSQVSASWVAKSERLSIWRMIFAHSDSNDAAIQWSTEVDVIADDVTEVKVRLNRSRLDNTVGPPGDRPRPPGCIRSLVESPDLAIVDGGSELSLDPIVVRRPAAGEFAQLVLARDRRLPIVAYTQRDVEIIDGDPLIRDLLGLAHIRLVLSDTSWALSDLLPRGTNVYGGAVRIIWPGVTLSNVGTQHSLWFPDAPAQRVYGQVASKIITAGVGQAAEDSRIVETERMRRQGEAEALKSRLDELGHQLEFGQLEADDALAQLRDAEKTVGELAADRDLWAELAAHFESENGQTNQTLRRIESERDHWRFAAEQANEALRKRGVEVDDPERAFRAS